MNAEQLRQYLIEHGLERVADELVKIARPGIRIRTHPTTEEEIPVGSSKMGGLPDLPIGMDWPVSGVPMAFIGQFNLAEVHPFDQENLLPESGLLSFFLSKEADENNEIGVLEGRVFYFDKNTSQLKRFKEEPDNELGFLLCSVSFESVLTLPNSDSPAISSLKLPNSEMDLYEDLTIGSNQFFEWEDESERYTSYHQLFGYPYSLDDSILEQNNQRLLLQVDSSEDLQTFLAHGVLHFYISDEDLRNKDFSQIYLRMSSL